MRVWRGRHARTGIGVPAFRYSSGKLLLECALPEESHMRNFLTAGIVLGLLAGCSSNQGPAAAGTDATTAAGSALAGDVGPTFTSRAPMAGFASLPDRGELLAYEKG